MKYLLRRIAAFIGVFLCLHYAVLQLYPPLADWLAYAVPVAINLGLAVLFARTLLPKHIPLITHFAYLSHPPEEGAFPLEFEAFTTRQTVYWVLLCMLSAFALLAAIPYADVLAWSFWGNLLVWGTQVAWFILSHRHVRRRYGINARPLKSLRLILHPAIWLNTESRSVPYVHTVGKPA